jgi:Asp-tRNA(Asn)/Glu-tRNA(Gln) amidotransferase A subunit family amidase
LKGYVPPEDAQIVKRLRDAGAIILGKMNLHEFAVWGETISSLGGQTLNPYDLTRTPGGSSGGTGAGLAANFGMLGIGTDTLNSIRSPASANSIVGIRPTLGLVSRNGIIPYSFTQDAAGPMARRVTDAAKMLTVLAGYDPADPDTAWDIGHVDQDYARYLDSDALKGARIGVLEHLFGSEPIHQEVNDIVRSDIERMKATGAVIVSIDDPMFDANRLVSEVSVLSSPAASCRSRGRASGGPQWRCRIRDGLPGHHGTRRLFQADHHRGDRRSGGHRVPRSPMERAGADPHRPRLRAGDELSSATAQYAQLGVKRPAIGGSSSKIIAPTNRIEPTMMA